jgi:hypothetical protein
LAKVAKTALLALFFAAMISKYFTLVRRSIFYIAPVARAAEHISLMRRILYSDPHPCEKIGLAGSGQ